MVDERWAGMSPAKYRERAERAAHGGGMNENEQWELANDKDMMIRQSLALNPEVGVRIQSLLSKDEKASVRWTLARNSKLKGVIQEVLAEDLSINVRLNLAANPGLTIRAAILLYFGNESTFYKMGIEQALENCNPKLYEQLLKLEEAALGEAKVKFVGLGSKEQQREVVKKIILEEMQDIL